MIELSAMAGLSVVGCRLCSGRGATSCRRVKAVRCRAVLSCIFCLSWNIALQALLADLALVPTCAAPAVFARLVARPCGPACLAFPACSSLSGSRACQWWRTCPGSPRHCRVSRRGSSWEAAGWRAAMQGMPGYAPGCRCLPCSAHAAGCARLCRSSHKQDRGGGSTSQPDAASPLRAPAPLRRACRLHVRLLCAVHPRHRRR